MPRGALDAWTGGNVPHAGRAARARKRSSLHAIPFLPQDDYDRLLWACDVNFVRGEDSFVRAQWAARPFVWHIYPQADDAHLRKLDAFVDRYAAALAPDAGGGASGGFSHAWNGRPAAATDRRGLARLRGRAPRSNAHAARWAAQLAALPELATGLVKAARIGYN